MNERLSSDLAALRIERAPASPPARRSPAIAWGIALGAVVALAAALAPGVIARSRPVEVEVKQIAPPAPSRPSAQLTTTGYVTPERVVHVGAKVAGRITRSLVREGQAVKAGEVLFALDPGDQERALAAARARARAASARAKVARASLAETMLLWQREARLVAGGASAPAAAEDLGSKAQTLTASVDAADAEVAAALADAATLAAGLGDLVVKAPIDGVALTRPAEVGEVVGPGTPLVEIADPASLLIEAEVPEARLGAVREKGLCEIVLDAFPDRRLRGEVTLVGPRVNRAKATGLVKVKLLDDAPLLQPDMAARVDFLEAPLDGGAQHVKEKEP